MPRLFVALPLIFSFKEQFKPLLIELAEISGIKLVPLENLHVTLQFVGQVNALEVDRIIDALQVVGQQCSSFSVIVQKVGVFPDLAQPRVVWARLESLELIRLMELVRKVLSFFCVEEKERTVHLTLARFKPNGVSARLKKFVEEHKDDVFGQLLIDRVVLYESTLTGQGPIYKPIKEILLRV